MNRYLRPRLNGTRLRRVVFLRDPVNTIASLAKRCRARDFRSLFKYFYQVVAFEEIVRRLATNPSSFCERVVLMSRWLRDDAYRAEVARDFDLTPGPPPRNVTRQGGGSSFNGTAYVPGADQGALHERWRIVTENPLFLAPFADPATIETMRTYFRMFGAQESVDPATVDGLVTRASSESGAAEYVRRVLQPLRRARGQIEAMEFAPQPAIRELWKGVVTTRMMLRI